MVEAGVMGVDGEFTAPVCGPGLLAQPFCAPFDRAAARWAGRPAVCAVDGHLTYRELSDRADRLAGAMLAADPAPGGRVGLLLPQSAGAIVALYASFRAGKTAVPLDPAQPPSRLASILENADTGLNVINGPELLAALGEVGVARPHLDLTALPDEPTGRPSGPTIAPEAAVLISYTSGSSGQPKGVVNSNFDLLHDTWRDGTVMRIGSADRVLLPVHYAYKRLIKFIHLTLTSGAVLHLLDARTDGLAQVVELLRREAISATTGTPTLLRALIGALGPDDRLPALRLVALNGEPLYGVDVERLRPHTGPDCVVLNVFGATEAGTVCTFPVDGQTALTGATVPAGYVRPDCVVTLLDESGAEVAPGEAGEIVVRSRFMARGYWRLPEQTAAAFRPMPGSDDERCYYTGDLGRFEGDGYLVHLGRQGSMVKIRGQRVELGEVESALQQLDGVEQAVVVARANQAGEQRLLAYLVPAQPPGPDQAVLRRALGRVLPSYMVPATYVVLKRLPLNDRGKVDRRALPEPAPEAASAVAAPPSGGSDLETRLTQLWRELLRTPNVGLDDNFMELGGDSLRAISLLLEIERRFGVRLPHGALFPDATIRRLAALIRGEAAAPPSTPLVLIRAGGERPPLFCVSGVGAALFTFQPLVDRLDRDRPLYGLSVLGMETAVDQFTRLEQLASFYLEALRSVRPHGPYHLVGYSFGGALVFEMARQLEQSGQAVGLLANIDLASPSARFRWSPVFLARMLGALPGLIRGLAELPPAIRNDRIRKEARAVASVSRSKLRRLLNRSPGPRAAAPHAGDQLVDGESIDQYPEMVRRVARPLRRLLSRYRPRPCSSRLVLFRSSVPWLIAAAHPALGWSGLAGGGVDVHVVPGTHQTMVQEPNVGRLAVLLERELRTIEAGLTDAR